MKQIEVMTLGQTNFSLHDVYHLTQEVYSSRAAEGIDFTVTKQSFEEYEKKIKESHKTVFVAINIENGELCGSAALTIHSKKKGRKYGGMTNVAVRKDYQHDGVGTLLLLRCKIAAQNNGCEYLISTTAWNALSSVRWHLKNGYREIGLTSDKENNYYSLCMRMQLKSPSVWNLKAFTNSVFLLSVIKTKLLFEQDGSITAIGKLLKKIF